MVRNYYCLVAGLPDLIFDDSKISTTLLEFRQELEEALHPKDFQQIKFLFLHVDHENLLKFLFDESKDLDPLGNFTLEDFEEQKRILSAILKEPDILPEYMVAVMEDFYSEDQDYSRLELQKKLSDGFYKNVFTTQNEFVRQWFTFELDGLNLLTAQNCSKHNIPLEEEIIGAGDLAKTLKKSGLKDTSLINDSDFLLDIAKLEDVENYLEKERKFDQIKWNFLDDRTFFYYFSIEKIVAYVIKLMIVDRWSKLDAEQGKELFKKLINDLEQSYEFPAEFNVKK